MPAEKVKSRLPGLSRGSHILACGAMLCVAKGVSTWVFSVTYARAGGDPGFGALVAMAALGPAFALEVASLVMGWRLASRFRTGPSLDTEVQESAASLGVMLYACFFASAIGLFAAGLILNLSIAVAACVLAPYTPMLVASGVLRLLATSVAKGAEFEQDARSLI